MVGIQKGNANKEIDLRVVRRKLEGRIPAIELLKNELI